MIIDAVNRYIKRHGWASKSPVPLTARDPVEFLHLGFKCPMSLAARVQEAADDARCSKSHVLRAIVAEKFGAGLDEEPSHPNNGKRHAS